MNKTEEDLLKTLKKQIREEEIALYGKPIPKLIVTKNKKKYCRKYKHKLTICPDKLS